MIHEIARNSPPILCLWFRVGFVLFLDVISWTMFFLSVLVSLEKNSEP